MARAASAGRWSWPARARCTRSERPSGALLRLLRERGIDGFETNAKIHGYEVDFLWRDCNLAVEVDGYDAHSGRAAFEHDRLKAATLRANGTGVMPITGRQIRSDAEGVIDRILRSIQLSVDFARLQRLDPSVNGDGPWKVRPGRGGLGAVGARCARRGLAVGG
jgi:very-short-patch-repair endonuclease